MRIELGDGPTVYGTVETSPHGLVITADTAEHKRRLENIVRNMRRHGQSDADLLAGLPRALDYQLWARILEQPKRPSTPVPAMDFDTPDQPNSWVAELARSRATKTPKRIKPKRTQ